MTLFFNEHQCTECGTAMQVREDIQVTTRRGVEDVPPVVTCDACGARFQDGDLISKPELVKCQ